MKKLIPIIIALVFVSVVTLCCTMWYNNTVSPESSIPTESSNPPIFTLDNYPVVDASLAIHPLVDALASDFLGIAESELKFEYTTTRSSYVYRNLIDGKADVIFASEISSEDQAYADSLGVKLNITPATASGFVFIVNKDNPVDNLTYEEVQKIYTGEITNWSEVGGNDSPIIPYQRPQGSGSQTAMLNLVMKDKEIMDAPLEQIRGEMGELIDAVAEFDNAENAIGYSYFYYVNTMYKRDNIKMLSIDSVLPTIETIKNGTYPIYTNGFIVTRSDSDENTKKWAEAVLSDRGSRIIEDMGYVPVR